MYDDDSTIFSSQERVEDLEIVLLEELKSVVESVKNNNLVLNVGKTKSIVFGTKHVFECTQIESSNQRYAC